MILIIYKKTTEWSTISILDVRGSYILVFSFCTLLTSLKGLFVPNWWFNVMLLLPKFVPFFYLSPTLCKLAANWPSMRTNFLLIQLSPFLTPMVCAWLIVRCWQSVERGDRYASWGGTFFPAYYLHHLLYVELRRYLTRGCTKARGFS